MHEELTEKGTEYLLNGKYDKALETYQRAADQGSYLAMYNIACMYYFGDGVKKDDSVSYQWFCKASDAGDPEAASRAGVMAEKGIGTEKDMEKAFHLYQTAANRKSLSGMANLALCYLEGKGTQKNIDKGIVWMQKASEGGNGIASEFLGDCYRNGKYVAQNDRYAVSCYEKGLSQKYAPAVKKLAEMTEKGLGTDKDLKKASELYAKAEALENIKE